MRPRSPRRVSGDGESAAFSGGDVRGHPNPRARTLCPRAGRKAAPMTPTLPSPALLPRALSTAQFQTLAEVPPEIEWFANLTNANTRRAYEQDIEDFMAFAGLRQPTEFRDVTRAHVIAWREQLVGQGLANDTIRRKLAALSSLYAYLCDRNAVLHNPVLGVKRPRSMNREGGDAGAERSSGVDAPEGVALKISHAAD